MKELVDKISSYNIFNYLMPGIVFAVLAKTFTSNDLLQEDILVGAFMYYFIGLIISRVGSLIVEPILKRFGFIKVATYEYFVAVEKKDAKLETLSEQNNSYRTLIAVVALLLLLKGYDALVPTFPALVSAWPYSLLVPLVFLFVASYVKQNRYINKRIDAQTPPTIDA